MSVNADKYAQLRALIDGDLCRYLPTASSEKLLQSMRYSLMSGGKRLRPVLFYAVLAVYGKAVGEAERLMAAAIEYIHSYSLVHDDLPAMDNDDLRRGSPTNHVVYGEAIALLAGDALLNRAFELLFSAIKICPDYAAAATIIADFSGAEGMIGGQAFEFDGSDLNDEKLMRELYDKKCGKLISAALVSAATCCGCDESQRKMWRKVGENFGLAFQLKDDLLDEGNQSGEITLLGLLGKEKTEREFSRAINEIAATLRAQTSDTDFIFWLITTALGREKDGM